MWLNTHRKNTIFFPSYHSYVFFQNPNNVFLTQSPSESLVVHLLKCCATGPGQYSFVATVEISRICRGTTSGATSETASIVEPARLSIPILKASGFLRARVRVSARSASSIL